LADFSTVSKDGPFTAKNDETSPRLTILTSSDGLYSKSHYSQLKQHEIYMIPECSFNSVAHRKVEHKCST